MKTPEEIKKGLVEAIEETSWVVEGGDAHDLQDACEKAHASMADALAYIQQLETENHQLLTKAQQLESTISQVSKALCGKENATLKELLQAADQLKARAPRWISVEERLPEVYNDVLVYQRRGESWCLEMAHIDEYHVWRDMHFDALYWKVTHWMPLPEPPKEDGK